MQHTIEEKLRSAVQKKYKSLDMKLTKLTQQQIKTPREPQTFYLRIANNTSLFLFYFNFRAVHFVIWLGITNKCINSYQFII
jgi:hypothetical protein